MSIPDRFPIEQKERWQDWASILPFIPFPSDWRVQIIPPFLGALVRFKVKTPHHDITKSIYLDVNDSLGVVGKPYWEVYPVDGVNERCDLDDIKTLLELIEAK